MYGEVVDRYVHMGVSEFLRDFRKAWEVQRTIAHRNMVMVRKEKKKRKDAKVSLAEIGEDVS